jgi:hypothetical protein
MAESHFDFGLWQKRPTHKAVCPKHGLQKSGFSVSVPPVVKDYCAECFIELLDQFCQPLEYTNEDDGSL